MRKKIEALHEITDFVHEMLSVCAPHRAFRLVVRSSFFFLEQQLLLAEINRVIYFNESQLLLAKTNED